MRVGDGIIAAARGELREGALEMRVRGRRLAPRAESAGPEQVRQRDLKHEARTRVGGDAELEVAVALLG